MLKHLLGHYSNPDSHHLSARSSEWPLPGAFSTLVHPPSAGKCLSVTFRVQEDLLFCTGPWLFVVPVSSQIFTHILTHSPVPQAQDLFTSPQCALQSPSYMLAQGGLSFWAALSRPSPEICDPFIPRPQISPWVAGAVRPSTVLRAGRAGQGGTECFTVVLSCFPPPTSHTSNSLKSVL